MRRLLALTCAMVLIDTVFYAALVPLVPYFTEELGLSKSTAGVLSGAFAAGGLLGSAPGGYSAVRHGVRPTALIGLCLTSVASLLFGFASGTWELITHRLAAEFGSALSWVSALRWLTEQTPKEQRGQMLGTSGSAAVVGALLAPMLGSVAATVGILLAFALVSGAGLAVALWAWITPAPSASAGEWFSGAFSALLRLRLASGLILIGFSPLIFGVLAVLTPLKLASLGWGAAAVGAAGALAFGATNFAWASGYAEGTSLGGVLADLGGDALCYLSLAAACLLALLLLRQVAE